MATTLPSTNTFSARSEVALAAKACLRSLDLEGAALASRMGKLSQTRNQLTHPDVGLLAAKVRRVLCDSSGSDVHTSACGGSLRVFIGDARSAEGYFTAEGGEQPNDNGGSNCTEEEDIEATGREGLESECVEDRSGSGVEEKHVATSARSASAAGGTKGQDTLDIDKGQSMMDMLAQMHNLKKDTLDMAKDVPKVSSDGVWRPCDVGFGAGLPAGCLPSAP